MTLARLQRWWNGYHQPQDARPASRRRRVPLLEVLEDRTAPAVVIWTGAGQDGNWSRPANWQGGDVAEIGDALVFGPGAARHRANNDLAPNRQFHSITFLSPGYTLTGHAVVLHNGVHSTLGGAGGDAIRMGITLAPGQGFAVTGADALVRVSGAIDGATVVKTGNGKLVLANARSNAALTLVKGGALEVKQAVRTGNVRFTPTASFHVGLDGARPGVSRNRLIVTGRVNLGSAALALTGLFRSGVKDSYTLIRNDRSDAVRGTFAGLAEGAAVVVQDANGTAHTFTISYRGGTGNDVVLTLTPAPHAPAGTDNTVTTNGIDRVFATADFGFSDPNDNPSNALLAVKVTTLPTHGILTNNGAAVVAGQFVSVTDINAGRFKFTPDANDNGAPHASFTFQVQDDGGAVNGGADLDPSANTLTVNEPPTLATAIGNVSVANNAADTTIDLAGFFSDPNMTNSQVRIMTSAGPITVDLFDTIAPRTVANFFNYVLGDRYDDTVFHRRISNFVLQGGGFEFNTGPSRLDPVAAVNEPTVQNEFGTSNTLGTLAMAKRDGEPDSATSQFFFNLANNGGAPNNLDTNNGGFTVFGRLNGAADQAVVNILSAFMTRDFSGGDPNNPFANVPLNNYTGTSFPTDTTADNYALISDVRVVRRDEFLAYLATSDNPALVTATITDNRLVLDYQPGQAGTATINVRAVDRFGAFRDTSFTVTVSNTAPVATNNSPPANGQRDTPFNGDLSALATDADGDSLTFSEVSDPGNRVTVNPNGTFTFTPVLGFSGPYQFTFKANDGMADSNVARFTVVIP